MNKHELKLEEELRHIIDHINDTCHGVISVYFFDNFKLKLKYLISTKCQCQFPFHGATDSFLPLCCSGIVVAVDDLRQVFVEFSPFRI